MVKVSFGDFGSIEDLRRNIQAIRNEAEDDARAMLAFADTRAARGPIAKRRTHVNALVALFILELMEVRIRWANAAEEFIGTWTEAKGNEAAFEQGDEAWLEIRDRLKLLLADADRHAAWGSPPSGKTRVGCSLATRLDRSLERELRADPRGREAPGGGLSRVHSDVSDGRASRGCRVPVS